MVGGMKKLRVRSCELRVRGTAGPACNSKLTTRNSQLAVISLAAVLAAWPLSGGAQIVNDPTRPPAGTYSTDSGDSAAAAPVLQSVMITPTARTAIIGGETVKLGGMYGDARVVKITESGVVLRSATGTETLRMYPEVTMKPVEPAPAVSDKPARKNRRPAANTGGKQG